MSSWLNLNFQNSNSPLMEQLIFFHDHSMLILILITILVSYIMSTMLFNNKTNSFFLSGHLIEMIWTILPAIILLFIALPSLRLLYLLDEMNKPLISLKTEGRQWFWEYEMNHFHDIGFDAYLDVDEKFFRMLEVDNKMTLPFNIQIRVMVSAADVLHSWAIPSLGVKVDAVPGRVNQANFSMNRSGIFYGQCSEICGANHSFMPISVESIPLKYFFMWLL